MKKTLKLISALMALLMVFTVFAACKKDEGDAETSGQNVVDTGGDNNALDARDLGGQEFVIFDANNHPELHINFSEKFEGTAVEQSLYSRDIYLESRNNLNISYVAMNAADDVKRTMENFMASGERPYDIIMSRAAGGGLPSLATSGLLSNLQALPVLDLSGKWWSPWINEQLSLGGKTYFTTGDIVASVYDAPIQHSEWVETLSLQTSTLFQPLHTIMPTVQVHCSPTDILLLSVRRA